MPGTRLSHLVSVDGIIFPGLLQRVFGKGRFPKQMSGAGTCPQFQLPFARLSQPKEVGIFLLALETSLPGWDQTAMLSIDGLGDPTLHFLTVYSLKE